LISKQIGQKQWIQIQYRLPALPADWDLIAHRFQKDWVTESEQKVYA
jgi:hypothetical protein